MFMDTLKLHIIYLISPWIELSLLVPYSFLFEIYNPLCICHIDAIMDFMIRMLENVMHIKFLNDIWIKVFIHCCLEIIINPLVIFIESILIYY